MKINLFFRIILFFYVMLSGMVSAQINPDLEFSNTGASITNTGSVTTTSVTFTNNTDNATGNTFASYSPALTAIYEITDVVYPGTVRIGIDKNAPVAIYRPLSTYSSTPSNLFTSANSAAGTGITNNINYV